MSSAGLIELRARIDELDKAIVLALAERFALSRETLVEKHGDVQDPDREAAVLARVAELAERLGLDAAHAVSIYRLILRVSVEIQVEDSRNHAV